MTSTNWDWELWSAAAEGDTERVKHALENGANVNCKFSYAGDWQATPLHRAARHRTGCTEVATLLLNAGAVASQQTVDGTTALHIAAQDGNVALATLLLEHGADVAVQRKNLGNPLHDAVTNLELTRLLVEHGADVNSIVAGVDAIHKGRSVLDMVVFHRYRGYEAVAEYLRAKGAAHALDHPAPVVPKDAQKERADTTTTVPGWIDRTRKAFYRRRSIQRAISILDSLEPERSPDKLRMRVTADSPRGTSLDVIAEIERQRPDYFLDSEGPSWRYPILSRTGIDIWLRTYQTDQWSKNRVHLIVTKLSANQFAYWSLDTSHDAD